jgi:apoptotic chromatin condensation inducer in the nucleus
MGLDFKEESEEVNLVPPSTKPETRCLLITNLQRPFVTNSLQEVLNKTGTVTRFWVDLIKTHCYVEVEKNYIIFILV